MHFFLQKFSSRDLLYIAIFSSFGLAVKPIVSPLVHLISAPLMMSGGSLAGGLYMMWIALAVAIVKKPGTGVLVGFVQAISITVLGFFGNHGAVSIISYTLPGLLADLVALFFKEKGSLVAQTTMCSFANLSGTFVVTLLVMRLPFIPLMISLVVSIISGIFGGIISYEILKKLIIYRIIENK